MNHARPAVRVLTARESEDYARREAFGADSAYLAQLSRSQRFGWRGGGKTLVIAAIDADGSPACWAAFSADKRYPRLWHYGNLYTRPERRQLGLAQAVVSTGLDAARAAGVRHVVCLISEASKPSQSFHTRLGFAETPLRKSNLGVAANSAPLSEHAFARYDVSVNTLERRLTDELSSWGSEVTDAMLAVTMSQLAADRPLLPWRRAAARTGLMTLQNGATLYVRRGEMAVNVMLGRQPAGGTDRRPSSDELMKQLQALGRPRCAVFHDREFSAALAPHVMETFAVSAFKITRGDS
jgi:L-amino acid N-acyltransferase YncA